MLTPRFFAIVDSFPQPVVSTYTFDDALQLLNLRTLHGRTQLLHVVFVTRDFLGVWTFSICHGRYWPSSSHQEPPRLPCILCWFVLKFFLHQVRHCGMLRV
jgi:hypothetical protein